MSAILPILKMILKQVMISLLTDKFVKEIIVHALEKLATKTDNKVDDEVIKMVKTALESPEESK